MLEKIKKISVIKKLLLILFTAFALFLSYGLYQLGQMQTVSSEQIDITGEMYDEDSGQ